MGKDTEKEPESNITQDELINDIQNEVEIVTGNVSLSKRFPEVNSLFFNVTTYKDGKFKDIVIEHKGYVDVLNNLGFYKLNVGDDGYVFIHIKNNIIQAVTPEKISDAFIHFIKSIPEWFSFDGHKINLKFLIEKFYKNVNFFGKPKLSLLPTIEIESNKDNSDSAYFYYNNGFVECTADGYKFKDYNNLTGYIWKKQIIDFEFKPLDNVVLSEETINQSMISEFIYLICNKDFNRYKSLITLMGYLMHDYYKTERKAVVLTDSKISEANEGRTGKGLFIQALYNVRNYTEIPGKSYKQNEPFKHQTVTIDSQLIHIDDPTKAFRIELMYNDITSGLKVEKKGQCAFVIDAKIVISCNKTLSTDGGSSSKGRMYEFELADFFNDEFTPKDYFKKRLFDDWDNNEWQQFYNFMMAGMCYYFKHGVIKAKPINLVKRRLIDATKIEFYKWVEDMKFKENEPYIKGDLCDMFFSEYPELTENTDRASAVKFGKWFKIFIDLYGYKYETTKSNSVQKITLFKKSENFESQVAPDSNNDIF